MSRKPRKFTDEFKAEVVGSEFGMSATRAILFALHELGQEVESDVALGHLRDQVQNYCQRRNDLAAIAAFIASKREGIDGPEAEAARILHTMIRTERLG